MSFRPALAAILICALTAAPSRGAEDAGHAWTLPSGLRVVVVPGPGVATAGLFVRAGWDADPADARGTAELTAACVPQATTARDVRKLREDLHSGGASLTSWIGADHALLRLTASDGSRLLATLPILAESAEKPAFPAAVVDAAAAALLRSMRDAAGNPLEAASRAAAATCDVPAGPSVALPDPRNIRTRAAAGVTAFHAAHWVPSGAVLALSGVTPEEAAPAVNAAFGSWTGPAPAPAGDAKPATPAGAKAATVLVSCDAASAAVAVALDARAGGPEAALARHALLHVLAVRLGVPERIPGPLPAGRHDVLSIPVAAGSPGRLLTRMRRELAALAADGPQAAEVDAWRAAFASQEAAARQADPARAAFLAGLSTLRALPLDLVAATAAVDAAAVQRVASDLAGPHPALIAVAGADRLLARIREEHPLPCTLYGPPDPAAAAAAARGADLVRRALAAQGDPKRLAALTCVDERAEGMFHGIGTNIAVRTRTVYSLPSLAYVESVMYNHRRFIVNRLVEGECWVERSDLGTRVEHRFEKARLMERQAVVHPAFALARASGEAWLRDAGAGPDPGTQVIEVLHPVAGACRYTIKLDDLTLTGIDIDLRPLEDSTESHRYADFRAVDGVRLPHADSASATGRPWKDVTTTSIALPASLDPAFFLTPGRPDPDVLEKPGPPDGPTISPEEFEKRSKTP